MLNFYEYVLLCKITSNDTLLRPTQLNMKNNFWGSVLFNMFISPWTYEYDIQAPNMFAPKEKLYPQRIFPLFSHKDMCTHVHRAAVWLHLDWHLWGQSQHNPEGPQILLLLTKFTVLAFIKKQELTLKKKLKKINWWCFIRKSRQYFHPWSLFVLE